MSPTSTLKMNPSSQPLSTLETTESAKGVHSSGEVCIIQADEGLGNLLIELLENQFSVKSFSNLKEFEKNFFAPTPDFQPDLILCDSQLRDSSGIEVLKKVRRKDATLPFILLVNQPEPDWTQEAFKAGVTDLIEKPFESFLFIQTFHGRIAQARACREKSILQELLISQLHLLTTHTNRIIDQVNSFTPSPMKKIRYASTDEASIRFQHASKREEKLLAELDQFRREYLELAEKPGKE